MPSQRRRVHDAPVWRAACVGLVALALLCAGMVGCASARAGSASEVRVLVYDDIEPVSVGPPENPSKVRINAGSLFVDGRLVGATWKPNGTGPWKVGSRTVRGRITLRASSDRIQVLNRIGLEHYVASTVGGEMSPSWPEEALRAQAVAARTYVLHEAAKRRGSDWDVRATAMSQVYRGVVTETDETRAAARATAGQVITYRGEPILAVFHSTAGGRTATAGEVWGRDLPYLRVVEVDEEDEAPHTYWRSEFSRGDLAGVLASAGVEVGGVAGLSVTRRTGSGRVARLEVRGAKRVDELRGARLRGFISSLGLRSALFDIRTASGGFAFVGSGYGHGVGMSQWGARALAERGESYQRILARFYPGTRLENWTSGRLSAPAQAFARPRQGTSGGELK